MGSFNGSGTFVRTYDWTTDEGNGINIEASRMDTEDDGFATGLSTCITKDGQTTISANIPFNSKKITGLGNGSARTDSIALGQVQDNTYGTLGTLGGSADTYTATPSPAITAYATGMEFNMKVNADNTGASTLNVNGVGATDVKKYDGAGAKIALVAGDLQQDQYYKVIYDGTDFVLMNPTVEQVVTANIGTANIDNAILTSGGELTISSGAVTITNSNHTIDTESDAASDDLDTINGGTTGQVLTIGSAADARDVVIKHGTGNIITDTQTDITLGLSNDKVTLLYDGTNWIVISRSVNNDFLASKASSGYTYLPNGMLFQWGVNTLTDSSGQTITFPVAFPNSCLRALGMLTDTVDATANLIYGGFSTTQITGINPAASGDYSWFAIGY